MSFMETHTPYHARLKYHTPHAKTRFDKIRDFTAEVYIYLSLKGRQTCGIGEIAFLVEHWTESGGQPSAGNSEGELLQ